MRRSRGATLVEALAAVALLGIAIVASTGAAMSWRHHAARIDETLRADQAVTSEMDELRSRSLRTLRIGTQAWVSGADRGSGLDAPRAEVIVAHHSPGLRRVEVVLAWGDGRISRREVLVEAP